MERSIFWAAVFSAALLIRPGMAAEDPPDVLHAIAQAYGLEVFSQVEALCFTFNGDLQGDSVRREWIWDVAHARVTYKGQDLDGALTVRTISLRPHQGTSEFEQRIQDWFSGDQYWLLFPLHLVWDAPLDAEADGLKALPLSEGLGHHVVIRYPNVPRHRPGAGDQLELFLDGNNQIIQWVYRQKSLPKFSLASTWQDYSHAGPLVFALSHECPRQKIRIWFTNVLVKYRGDQQWARARSPEQLAGKF